MLILSVYSYYYRRIRHEGVFHPEFAAKSGQFCPKWFSIRNQGQNPDSSAQSGFPSGIRGKIRTVLREVGFPSGIRGKIRTVLSETGFPSGIGGKIRTVPSEAVFHPESRAKSGQFCPKRISIRNQGQNPDSFQSFSFPSVLLTGQALNLIFINHTSNTPQVLNIRSSGYMPVWTDKVDSVLLHSFIFQGLIPRQMEKLQPRLFHQSFNITVHFTIDMNLPVEGLERPEVVHFTAPDPRQPVPAFNITGFSPAQLTVAVADLN